LTITPPANNSENNKQGQEGKQNNKGEGKGRESAVDFQIVEPSGKSKKPKLPKPDSGTLPVQDLSKKDRIETTGYYGIGVYTVYAFGPITNGVETYANGEQISVAVENYPAHLNGLLPGDIIVEVDGKRMDDGFDNIRADTDSEISLVIYRKGRFLRFRFKRAFIETIRGGP
jgi:hypothetical protein